jgi:hypothetical protein
LGDGKRNAMSTEKIAFLFPTREKGVGSPEKSPRMPLLVLDCEEFPTVTDIFITVFFIGLKHEKSYYLQLEMFYEGDTAEHSVSALVGTHLRAKDTLAHEDDIAASLDLRLENSTFMSPGNYFIQATLMHNQIAIHENRAYLKVSEVI